MGKLVIQLRLRKESFENMENKTNQVAKIGEEQQVQVRLLKELNVGAKEMGQDFTPEGEKCIKSAIAAVIMACKNTGEKFASIDQTMLKLQLQNIGYTELSFNAIPSEAYVDFRKVKDANKNEVLTIALKPQGAGNEKLLRRWGVDVKRVYPCWLVREGDEFTLGSFNGLNRVDPTWTPKSLHGKVVMVVYPVLRNDNTVEYLMADRESVLPNVVAQIRQNALYAFKKKSEKGLEYVDKKARDSFYAQLDKDAASMTLDELIESETYRAYINPTYTSSGSKESMIIRKMQNNALKRYPKDFATAQVAQAVENMFEDKDDTVREKAPITRTDSADKVDIDMTTVDENAPEDFAVEEFESVEKDSQPTTANETVTQVVEEKEEDNSYESLI